MTSRESFRTGVRYCDRLLKEEIQNMTDEEIIQVMAFRGTCYTLLKQDERKAIHEKFTQDN